MIKLEGIVLNVFTQQGGKDKKTGDQFVVYMESLIWERNNP